jgi:hypothetical protein
MKGQCSQLLDHAYHTDYGAAIILVGGFGTRLRPLVCLTPTPLARLPRDAPCTALD